MAEEVTARVSRYVNDGSDRLRRLLRGAELVATPGPHGVPQGRCSSKGGT